MESNTAKEQDEEQVGECEKSAEEVVFVSETKPQEDEECSILSTVNINPKKRKYVRQRSMKKFLPNASVYKASWDDKDKGRAFIGRGENSPYMYWDDIVVAMVYEIYKKRGLSASDTVNWFKKWFPGIKNFDRLKATTVTTWGSNGGFRKVRGRKAVDEEVKIVVKKYVDQIVRPGEVHVPMTLAQVHNHVLKLLEQQEPDLFANGWKCSLTWFTKFVYKELGFSLRRATTGRDLPENWEELQKEFCERLTIRVNQFDIRKELVVNADQTGWHLAPHRGRTLAFRGVKSVPMEVYGDKRQVTMMVALSASGEMLPLQFIFKGQHDKVKGKDHEKFNTNMNWLFSTNKLKHWASLETMKEWVKKVLHPYYVRKMNECGILNNMKQPPKSITQRCVLILDCWKVHISQAFVTWMRAEYPYILLLYVPARCTSKLQPVDLVGNFKLKALAVKAFENYLFESIVEQVSKWESETGPKADQLKIKLDLSMVTLRDRVPYFAEVGYKWFQSEDGQSLIRKGWESAGLSQCFDKSYQQETLLKIHGAMKDEQRKAWHSFLKEQEENEKNENAIAGSAWERWQDKSVVLGCDQDEPDQDDSGIPTEEDLENSLDDFGMIERLGAFLTQHITLPTAEGDMVEQLERYPKFQSAWKNPTKPQRVPGRGRGRPKGSKNKPKEPLKGADEGSGGENSQKRKRGRPKGSKNKPKSVEQPSTQNQPRILSMLITEDAPSNSEGDDKIVCEEKGIELEPDEAGVDVEDGSEPDPQCMAVTDDSGSSDDDDDEQDKE